jgi:hypothetical protein
MATKDEIDRALDQGALQELPPNIPPGFMGEVAPNMNKPDDFHPSLNAGVIQESTWETNWLTILLCYLLIVGSPVAVWMLWREPRRSLTVKVVATALGVAGYVALYWYYSQPHT